MPQYGTPEWAAYQQWLPGQVPKSKQWATSPAYTGKSLANPLQTPAPQPSAAPQTISRPLDLRKGAEIRLTEAEVQLAMSPVPAGGAGNLGRGKSGMGMLVTYQSYSPKPPSAPVQKCLSKILGEGQYQSMKKVTDKWLAEPDKLDLLVTWLGKGKMTRAKYIELFHQYEKAWLELQAQQAAQSTGTSSGDEIPF